MKILQIHLWKLTRILHLKMHSNKMISLINIPLFFRAAGSNRTLGVRNQTGWGTYCCMNPKMMGATCRNRLRSLLTMYHVLKFLKKSLKIHCHFWKMSISITLLFFLRILDRKSKPGNIFIIFLTWNCQHVRFTSKNRIFCTIWFDWGFRIIKNTKN